MPRANSPVPLLVGRLLLTRSQNLLMNCPAGKTTFLERSFGDSAVAIAGAVAFLRFSSRANEASTHA